MESVFPLAVGESNAGGMVTCLIAVTRYQTEATLERKGLLGSQFLGAQPSMASSVTGAGSSWPDCLRTQEAETDEGCCPAGFLFFYTVQCPSPWNGTFRVDTVIHVDNPS